MCQTSEACESSDPPQTSGIGSHGSPETAGTPGTPTPSGGLRILVAGVGNIFHGDDAFGVEVARVLAQRDILSRLPGVRVVDFGIRGLDLTYALLDGCDVAIIVDASKRGGTPGTLYVIEPSNEPAGEPTVADLVFETHGMNPDKVLRAVRAMGGQVRRIVVVACEPLKVDADDMSMEISPPVQAAVEQAAVLVESLVESLIQEGVDACVK